MDNRPIIGITTQTLDAIPDQLPRCWVMSQRYVQMLVTVGAVPWVIPLLATGRSSASRRRRSMRSRTSCLAAE